MRLITLLALLPVLIATPQPHRPFYSADHAAPEWPAWQDRSLSDPGARTPFEPATEGNIQVSRAEHQSQDPHEHTVKKVRRIKKRRNGKRADTCTPKSSAPVISTTSLSPSVTSSQSLSISASASSSDGMLSSALSSIVSSSTSYSSVVPSSSDPSSLPASSATASPSQIIVSQSAASQVASSSATDSRIIRSTASASPTDSRIVHSSASASRIIHSTASESRILPSSATESRIVTSSAFPSRIVSSSVAASITPSSAAPSVIVSSSTSSAAPAASSAQTLYTVDPYGNGPFSGWGTWFDVGLSACGTYDTPNMPIVAVSQELFDQWPGYDGTNPNNSPICGLHLAITWGGKTVKAEVTDMCPGCAVRSLDMSSGLFQQFADLSVGLLGMDSYTGNISWSWIEGTGRLPLLTT